MKVSKSWLSSIKTRETCLLVSCVSTKILLLAHHTPSAYATFQLQEYLRQFVKLDFMLNLEQRKPDFIKYQNTLTALPMIVQSIQKEVGVFGQQHPRKAKIFKLLSSMKTLEPALHRIDKSLEQVFNFRDLAKKL